MPTESNGGPTPAPTPPPPGRAARLRSVALRWAAGLGAVFALGIIATWIVQVGPRNRDLTQAREQLADAQRDLAEAQADLKRLSDLEQSNADLSHRLTLAEQRIDVLSALVAVTRAQAALGLGDETGARNALAEARRHLEDALLPAIEPGRRPQVEALLTRLELVLGELARDAFAAQSDLGVLANGLEELDAAMAEEGAG